MIPKAAAFTICLLIGRFSSLAAQPAIQCKGDACTDIKARQVNTGIQITYFENIGHRSIKVQVRPIVGLGGRCENADTQTVGPGATGSIGGGFCNPFEADYVPFPPKPPGPITPPGIAQTQLKTGEKLQKGFVLTSQNKKYGFWIRTSDGSLAIFRFHDQHIVWASSPHDASYLTVQPDGNLVLFAIFTAGTAPVQEWSTNIAGGAATTDGYLEIGDDGRLTLYKAGKSVWSVGGDSMP